MYNKAFLIGNLTRDPDLRYTPSGIPVVRFTIAVGRIKSKRTENSQTSTAPDADFINIVAWRRLAEICGEFLKKGRSVAIEGRLQVRTFEKNGVKRTITEVLADNMQMLGRKRDEPQASNLRQVTAEGTAQAEEKSDADASAEDKTPF